MNQHIDPKTFGLHPATKIERSGTKNFFILIDRKSRIIMKDGEKILDKVKKIKDIVPDAQVGLKTSAPVCSKTLDFLKKNGVAVTSL